MVFSASPLITQSEILATRLGESWTRQLCLALTIKNNKECTSGTHDLLIGTHQNFILQ